MGKLSDIGKREGDGRTQFAPTTLSKYSSYIQKSY